MSFKNRIIDQKNLICDLISIKECRASYDVVLDCLQVTKEMRICNF